MHQRHEKTLLIHGFSPVNARLLTVYGTAFYAIILNIIQLGKYIYGNFADIYFVVCLFVLSAKPIYINRTPNAKSFVAS